MNRCCSLAAKAVLLACLMMLSQGCNAPETERQAGFGSAEVEIAFWRLIEQSKHAGLDCHDQSGRLTELLAALDADSIMAFFNGFHQAMNHSYRQSLWDEVTTAQKQDCDRQCFETIRAALIAQGRGRYYAVLRDPSLIESITVEPACIELLQSSLRAYRMRTGAFMQVPEGLPEYTLKP